MHTTREIREFAGAVLTQSKRGSSAETLARIVLVELLPEIERLRRTIGE